MGMYIKGVKEVGIAGVQNAFVASLQRTSQISQEYFQGKLNTTDTA
jgi:hypothetical protein